MKSLVTGLAAFAMVAITAPGFGQLSLGIGDVGLSIGSSPSYGYAYSYPAYSYAYPAYYGGYSYPGYYNYGYNTWSAPAYPAPVYGGYSYAYPGY